MPKLVELKINSACHSSLSTYKKVQPKKISNISGRKKTTGLPSSKTGSWEFLQENMSKKIE